MKCKHIREAIDTTSRHTLYSDSVTTHLSGCPDCRRHQDGTASLLTLLSAQPRVEAPVDFDIKVRAGIARAQAELLNDKTTSLLTLLKAQPRVEAPADFDFRLSAGIARAQAERFSQASVFEKAWEKIARTLSLGQVATAAMAAALIITASAVYIKHDNSSPATTTTATTTTATTTTKDVAINRSPDPAPVKAGSAQTIAAPVVNPARMIPAKVAGRGVQVRPAMVRDNLQAYNNSSNDIANLDIGNPDKVYSIKTQQVVGL